MSVQCHVLLVCVSAVSSDATALSEAFAMCNPDSLQCMAGKFKHTFQRISGTSRSLTQLKITRRLTSAGTEAACLTTPLLLCFMRCVWRSPWQALPRQVPQFVQSTSAKASLSLHLHMEIADGKTSPPVWLCPRTQLCAARGVSIDVAETVAWHGTSWLQAPAIAIYSENLQHFGSKH